MPATMSCAFIPLTQQKVAEIDAADYAAISSYKWYFSAYGYAVRNGFVGEKRTIIYMHRLIVGAPSGIDIDHIDGNKINNRRCNLRLASRRENLFNKRPLNGCTSSFKGVNWIEPNKKWRARIRVNGREIALGCYNSALDAARAYNQAATEHFGEFAWLNPV
jgi:hypothetical protein